MDEKKGYEANIIKDFVKLRDVLCCENIINADTVELTAMPVLTSLKENYILCIVTNTRRNMFQHTHGSNEMYHLFDKVVYREDYVNAKPAPDSYLEALEKAKLNAGEVLVIEDSPRGIQAAQNAGIKAVAIRNPHFPNLNTSNADYHINSLTELDDLLKTL